MKIGQLASRSLMLIGATFAIGSAAQAADWPQYGGDIRNSRNQAAETVLSVDNVDSLEVKWEIPMTSDVTSTPAVEGGYVYFADWGTAMAGVPGRVYKADEGTGAVVWAAQIGAATGFPLDWVRHTPTVAGDHILVGNQGGRFGAAQAKLVSLDKQTGAIEWVTTLDGIYGSIVTSSPTVHDGVAYVGVASYEEAFAAIYATPCCTFRGSVAAVDVETGTILWQTYMAPEGFSGNAVWGSSPAVDVARNQVYIATGNNYSAPQSYHDCIARAKSDKQRMGCNPGTNLFDSVVALNMATGEVNWSKRVMPFDTWNVACAPFLLAGTGLPTDGVGVNCEFDSGPDFDFAQGPILYTATGPGMGQGADMIGVGQKSGVYWALRPSNGDVLWSTRTGPGGIGGGHQWGSASDGNRIYTSNANSFGFLLPDPGYQLSDGSFTKAGIFSALDARTGKIIWQIANPTFEVAGSPAAVANGVVYVCSVGGFGQPNQGNMYAINAATGEVLKNFVSGASCGGGAAIANGKVFWGHGYTGLGGSLGYRFLALGLPD